MAKAETPENTSQEEQCVPIRGMSAVIKQLQEEGKLFDPLMGETHTISPDGTTIIATETER